MAAIGAGPVGTAGGLGARRLRAHFQTFRTAIDHPRSGRKRPAFRSVLAGRKWDKSAIIALRVQRQVLQESTSRTSAVTHPKTGSEGKLLRCGSRAHMGAQPPQYRQLPLFKRRPRQNASHKVGWYVTGNLAGA